MKELADGAGDQRLLGLGDVAEQQLGDGQLDLPGARVPAPRPVPVALADALLVGALAELGADLRRDLGLHHLGDHPGHAFSHHFEVL